VIADAHFQSCLVDLCILPEFGAYMDSKAGALFKEYGFITQEESDEDELPMKTQQQLAA
jgi:hypothetical protein